MRTPRHFLAATLLALATVAGAVEKSSIPAEFILLPESDVAVVCAVHFTDLVKTLHAYGIDGADKSLALAWTIRTFWTERAWETGARPEAVERLSAAMSKLDDDAVAEHAVYCQAVGVSLFSALPAERRAEVLALAREQRDAWLSRH